MNTFLGIICFILGLGILITVHEFGHFITAKIFGVYCYEFSIGFGPKIIRKKRKKGETYFCIGVIPLGGYVSMYGEDDVEDEKKLQESTLNSEVETMPNGTEVVLKDEDIKIPFNRSLEGISKWKKAIVMSAGIVLNFILGYVLYFISVSAFPYQQITANISADEKISNGFTTQYNAMLETIDKDSESLSINPLAVFDINDKKEEKTPILIASSQVFINDDTDSQYVLVFNNVYSSLYKLDIDSQIYRTKNVEDMSYKYYNLYEIENLEELKNGSQKEIYIDSKKDYYENNSVTSIKTLDISFNLYKNKIIKNDNGDAIGFEPIKTGENILPCAILRDTLSMKNQSLDPIGLSFTLTERYLGFEAFSKAGDLWADGTLKIFKAVGGLFIGQNWDSVGGPISILNQTSQILAQNPFSYYVQIWGLISVNLAIMNLLPFPGLDGWHLLVCAIEGISRKKINNKIKSRVSTVGMLLLFGLMFAIIILDIVRLF